MPLGSGMTEINWRRLSIWTLRKLVVSSEFLSGSSFFLKTTISLTIRIPLATNEKLCVLSNGWSWKYLGNGFMGGSWVLLLSTSFNVLPWYELAQFCLILWHSYLVPSQPVVRSVQLESIAKWNRVLFVGRTHGKSVQNALLWRGVDTFSACCGSRDLCKRHQPVNYETLWNRNWLAHCNICSVYHPLILL